jgi:two-component system chemotaxis response regulator CheY
MDASLAPTAPSPAAPQRQLRILLVEDSPTMRLFLGAHLKALHPQAVILEAEDGKSAIRQLSTASVDLVVTDLRMPGMDGEGLVQLLKRNPLLRRKPVLVISAEADAAALSPWAAEPGLRFLTKPVEPARLASALNALLA